MCSYLALEEVLGLAISFITHCDTNKSLSNRHFSFGPYPHSCFSKSRCFLFARRGGVYCRGACFPRNPFLGANA